MNEKLRRQDDKKIDDLSQKIELHLQDSQAVRKELNTKIDTNEKTHAKDVADIKEMQKLILVQTTKHNGRMTKMEGFRNLMLGALGVLTLILVPLLTWALSQIVQIDSKVKQGTREAIDTYNLSIKEYGVHTK